MTYTRSTKRWLATAGALAVVLSLAAACGDDDDSSSADQTTTTQDVCAQAEDLQSSITDLSDIDVSEEGTNALDAAVDNIEQDVRDLASTVSDDLQPQVDDLESSLSSLKDAVANVDEDGGVNALVDAVQAVLTASTALIDEVTSADC
jgi:CHASE3 domain sensor protein